jgi:hypothetical protein
MLPTLIPGGDQLVMMISVHPRFVLLPDLSNLAANGYNSDGAETANFTSPTSVFVVYFSESTGRIVVTATEQTTLKYFAMKSIWPPSSYFVSSLPSEKWGSDACFTIGNSQDICLFHISDTVTAVAGQFDSQTDFDLLYYQYSGEVSAAYTGSGTFSDSSSYYTAFRWHSNSVTPSVSMSIQLSSHSSSLPCRRSRGSRTSFEPIILVDEEPNLDPAVPAIPASKPAVVWNALSCLAGVALLVVGAICLSKHSAAHERQEALRRILDRERF